MYIHIHICKYVRICVGLDLVPIDWKAIVAASDTPHDGSVERVFLA